MAGDREEAPRSQPIRVPELGLDTATIKLSVWLVATGALVAAGDRLVELLAGQATVDLSAPIDGRLVKKLAWEDAPVETGQVLGWVEPLEYAGDVD